MNSNSQQYKYYTILQLNSHIVNEKKIKRKAKSV